MTGWHAVVVGAARFDDTRREQLGQARWHKCGDHLGELFEGCGRAGLVDVHELIGLEPQDLGEVGAVAPADSRSRTPASEEPRRWRRSINASRATWPSR